MACFSMFLPWNNFMVWQRGRVDWYCRVVLSKSDRNYSFFFVCPIVDRNSNEDCAKSWEKEDSKEGNNKVENEVNDGQLLALLGVGDGLSSRNWSTWIRWGAISGLFLWEGKCGLDGAVLSAKDVLFSKFEAWLEIECEYESDEEYQLSDHQ
jgi:hypothetical protein